MHCLHFTKLFGSHDVANISTSPLRTQQRQQQQQQQQQQQSIPAHEGGVDNDEEMIQLQSPLLQQQSIDTATTAESASLSASAPAGTSSTVSNAQLPSPHPNDHSLPPHSPHRSTVAPSRINRTASVHSVDTAGKGTPVC